VIVADQARAFLFPPTDVAYASAPPFPHAVLSAAWDPEFLARVAADVSAHTNWDGEKNFNGAVGKRWSGRLERLPASVRELVHVSASPMFLTWLEELTGEAGLIPDPYLQGGGIHSSGHGAFLKMHADFNWHEKLGLYRRLNVLIYLSRNWQPAWGGDLRLAGRTSSGALNVEKSIAPEFNTMVVFTTDENSFHGHPDPIVCPPEARRDSIALYYYSAAMPSVGASQGRRSNTDYRALDGTTLPTRPPGLTGTLARAARRILS
jgi:hypothetical protein